MIPGRPRPPQTAQPPTDRQRGAARCLDYGALAHNSTILRNLGMSQDYALDRADRISAARGYADTDRRTLERQEIVEFVYATPTYTPDAARDYVLLWCTQQYLPGVRE